MRPEFLQSPGGVAARFGAIRKAGAALGVRDVEVILAEVKFPDLGMTYATDSAPPTYVRACPYLAEHALAEDNS